MPELRYRASLIESVAVIVGIVIGAGIFRTPPIVASMSGSELAFLGIWFVGGAVSLIGALCYAELTTTYPHEGGDYIYYSRAFGDIPSFLFVWARMTVIQTGSIAMFAFIIGDYATSIAPLGSASVFIYAVISIVLLTILNGTGIHRSYLTQKIFLGLVLASIALVFFAGVSHPRAESVQAAVSLPPSAQFGRAIIFVLLTYGGWTEAAFISRELCHSPKTMVRALIVSIAVITTLYMATNFAYLTGLGLDGISSTQAVGADIIRNAFGNASAALFSVVIISLALSSMNGTMITGARSNFALGRDYKLFGFLGRLTRTNGNPFNAYLLQGAIAIGLVAIGAASRSGFETMVDYTAPVFWFFIILTVSSLFVLRRRDRGQKRPFSVPWYPFLPILFLLSSVYMLHSSVTYSGIGSFVGLAVLGAGIIVFFLTKKNGPVEIACADGAEQTTGE